MQADFELLPPIPPRGGRPPALKLAGFLRICARIREGRHRWGKEQAASSEGISYETLRRRAKRQQSWRKYLTYSERVGEEATLDYHRQNMTDHSQVDWRASERYVLLHDPNFARMRLTNNGNVSTNFDPNQIDWASPEMKKWLANRWEETREQLIHHGVMIYGAADEPVTKTADAKLVEFPRDEVP